MNGPSESEGMSFAGLTRHWKSREIPIVGLTVYDYPTAIIASRVDPDLVLVGDSVGPMVLGKSIELVTLDEMISHTAAVKRGAPTLPVVGDLPLGTYDEPRAALANVRRFIGETDADAIKIEGGKEILAVVELLVENDIPIVGHLTPEHLGIQTDGWEDAAISTAVALAEAGVSALVLVGLSGEVSNSMTRALQKIPTIGSHPCSGCDGRIGSTPRLVGLALPQDQGVGSYAALGSLMLDALQQFVDEFRIGDPMIEQQK